MELKKNLSFLFLFIFIFLIVLYGSENIIYSNHSLFLIENESQFVKINNSLLQNKLIFIIIFFFPISLFFTNNILNIKFIRLLIYLSLLFLFLIFVNYYVVNLYIFYVSIALFLLFLSYLIPINFYFKIYFNKIRLKLEHIVTLSLIIILFYISYLPIFYTYDLDIYLSYFNIHNYSLSGIFSFNDEHKFINSNYYNNFYNIFFKFFYTSQINFPVININFFILLLNLILFYLYVKIIFYCNRLFKNKLISLLFLIFSISYIFNFDYPALQISYRYLIIFIYLYFILKINKINHFNFYIYFISVIAFFHNIESFIIINFLNLLLFINFKKTIISKLISYFIFTLIVTISVYFLFLFINYFFYLDLSIYKNIIIGTTNGFARSFPKIDNFSLFIFIIISHTCSLIIFDIKKLLKNINLQGKNFINIFLGGLILYFSIFYFRRGFDTAHTDIIIILYFIIFSQQINLFLKKINNQKYRNSVILYSINFPKINFFNISKFNILFSKPLFNKSFEIKSLNFYTLKIFFLSLILFSNFLIFEFTISNSAFDKYQIKNFNSIIEERNLNLDNSFSEINEYFEKNKIQIVFSRLHYDKNIPTNYDYIFGIDKKSNQLNTVLDLPIEYQNNLIYINNYFPNFDIFTPIKYNKLAGFNIPDLEYKIIKDKADFLKGKNIYYISDYSFFINLYNNETPSFFYYEPFNDLLTKEAFNNFINKIIIYNFDIAIDCINHMADLKGKNFYSSLINKILQNKFFIVDSCNKSGFMILRKKS